MQTSALNSTSSPNLLTISIGGVTRSTYAIVLLCGLKRGLVSVIGISSMLSLIDIAKWRHFRSRPTSTTSATALPTLIAGSTGNVSSLCNANNLRGGTPTHPFKDKRLFCASQALWPFSGSESEKCHCGPCMYPRDAARGCRTGASSIGRSTIIRKVMKCLEPGYPWRRRLHSNVLHMPPRVRV